MKSYYKTRVVKVTADNKQTKKELKSSKIQGHFGADLSTNSEHYIMYTS